MGAVKFKMQEESTEWLEVARDVDSYLRAFMEMVECRIVQKWDGPDQCEVGVYTK